MFTLAQFWGQTAAGATDFRGFVVKTGPLCAPGVTQGMFSRQRTTAGPGFPGFRHDAWVQSVPCVTRVVP